MDLTMFIDLEFNIEVRDGIPEEPYELAQVGGLRIIAHNVWNWPASLT
jgi:hypothetical protein